MNTDTQFFDNYNESFQNEYFELLINRLTHSSMSLELDLGNADDSINAIKLQDNISAFKILLDVLPLNISMTEELIIAIANKVNASSMFISDGYRKIGNFLADTDIKISKAEDIHLNIINLIHKYENDWKDLDPFEREARFHIEFILIHPFEDGNGRPSRLLMNYNLLKQGCAPVIITNDMLDCYYEYIHNNDVEQMQKLFKVQSEKEQLIIDQLYSKYNKKTDFNKHVK